MWAYKARKLLKLIDILNQTSFTHIYLDIFLIMIVKPQKRKHLYLTPKVTIKKKF